MINLFLYKIFIMNKLKVIEFLSITLLILGSFIIFKNNQNLRKEVNIQKQNIETLLHTRDTLEISNRALLINTELLNDSNDSLIKELNNIRKDIRIKDKEIESLHKINSVGTKTDSIIIRDTLFKDKSVKIDTTLKNKWGSTHLKLEYPSSIKIESTMISDLSIFTYDRKETIKKPKKTKLGRFFQKKRKVLEVEVVENNPNIVIKQNKFIKIIK